ncbi:unnamed protein product [Symbiodinium natans]|uniref:Acyl-protein thioesterase 1 n=1 Tax=Symbiodinium natans TaxID=878477 RepID=A0A812V374_9DINO|nr:unnamed protein product [Symbiodinium natans]
MSLVLESITDLLPVICLGLIWRLGDMRLWCQTTFAGALLMALKGFVSWATIMPDTQGWKACKDRLGIDGLRYFREDRLIPDMLADILLLEVRGFWFARPSRRRLCADSTFSGGTSLSVLFCISLCEVSIVLSLRPSGRSPGEEADVLLPAIAQCIRYLLAALMVGNLVMPVLEGSQRAEAVALGVVAAIGVCNSPVLALAVNSWCRSWPAEDAAAPSMPDATPLSPTSTAALMGFTRLAGEEDWEDSLVDLGKVLNPPPWSVGREYCYLRHHPLPEAFAQKEGVMQQLLVFLRQSQEQLAKKEQKKSEMLKKEQADELVSAQRSDRFAEQRIQEADVNDSETPYIGCIEYRDTCCLTGRQLRDNRCANAKNDDSALRPAADAEQPCKAEEDADPCDLRFPPSSSGSTQEVGESRHDKHQLSIRLLMAVLHPASIHSWSPRYHRRAKAVRQCGGFSQVALCGLTVQKALRCKRQRHASAVEEVLITPPAQAEGEALVVWLHGLGDTGQGWSTTAPALQQLG